MKILLCSKYNTFLSEALKQHPIFSTFPIELKSSNEIEQLRLEHLGEILICDKSERSLDSQFSNIIVLQQDITLPFYLEELWQLLSSKFSNIIYNLPFEVKFKPQKRIIQKSETEVSLTEKEAAILNYLCDKYPQSLPVEKLLEDLWKHSEDVQTNTLEVHFYRLKQKLSELQIDYIINLKDQIISLKF